MVSAKVFLIRSLIICAIMCCTSAEHVLEFPNSALRLRPNLFPLRRHDTAFQRIKGGVETELHEFPSIVSLQYEWQNDGVYSHICTGSIVNENWMVTAGHCANVGPTSKYRVLAGGHNLYKYTGSEQLRNLQDIQVHPMYTTENDTLDYDLAMMMFDSPLSFSDFVNATNFPPKGFVTSGNGMAAGWGISSPDASTSSPMLRKVSLPAVNWSRCEREYAALGMYVTPRFFCAGGIEMGKSTCTGDSGGPFYTRNEDGSLVMTGLTSWSIACAAGGWPTAFTDAAVFHDYIQCVSQFKAPLTPEDNQHCGMAGEKRTSDTKNLF